ncbi:DUF3293 domain-containing protein [uncultured Vibrio sp.]|uniref:DUF3293 domain-containing protein n=1 Tax=uncultured Vibrio sp. TaxID=114054 RepID=UPI0009232D8C|nr:DUF3293 domain-containing protein [uncultured Vibrio sp.]OIQ25201.1 MAG: hypothetical protein BM561_06725 [Vibrio sp. MedPE-SWchi]
MKIDAHLWEAYSDPYFDFYRIPVSNNYAIITGWNRYGKLQSYQDNQLQNNQLISAIPVIEPIKVDVGNRGFTWFEESYAVELSMCSARELGVKFAQNAIYYVVDGELLLLACVEDKVRIIGPIKDRYCKRIT